MNRISPFRLLALLLCLTVVHGRLCATPCTDEPYGRAGDSTALHYFGETLVTVGGGPHTPFWLGANRDGRGAVDGHGPQLHVGLSRPTAAAYADFRPHWGGTVEVAVGS